MSAPEIAPPDLAAPATYSVWAEQGIRFQDVGRYGHVNNVAYLVYAESGRVEFLEQCLPGSILGDGDRWVIARLVLDFRLQGHYPGRMAVGTRILRIGRSSATLGQGMFCDGRCVATAESVVVLIDTASGQAVPVPDDARDALEAAAPD